VDTISNNDLDFLLEASKIEAPKELEEVFRSPNAEDNGRKFNLSQPIQPILPPIQVKISTKPASIT